MTRFDELDDLDAESRATALLLQDAFAGVRLDRPSPATTGEQDAETAQLVASAFDGVALAAPAPEAAPQAELVALPARRRPRRWPVLLAGAAAAVLGPTGSSPAWAAEPRTPTSSDVDAIAAACVAPLARGLGDLQGSGAVSVDGSPVDVPMPEAPQPPSTLPPLIALDIRGDVAFAVYQDAGWTVACVAVQDGDGWRDQGVQAGPGTSDPQPGILATSGAAAVGGEQITTVTGTLADDAARVTFRLDDGTQVEASVRGSTWAAWFPGDRRLDPSSITAYDDAGSATPLGR